MANFIGCMLLQRILWPSIIVACAFMRPTGISFVYLLMFFISPFIPVATPKNIRGSVGAYFIVWIALTSLLILLHIGLQIAVLVLGFENIIGKCSFLEILLRHIGFIHLMNLQPLAIAEWVVPEVLAFAASVILYVILKKIVVDTNEEEEVTDVVVRDGNVEEGFRQLRANKEDTIASSVIEKLQLIGPYISLAAIFLAAVLRPSVPGGLYFLIFLGGGTYWACYKSFGRAFRIVLQILLVIIVAHSIAIFTYQTPWPQQFLANSSLPARLSGLEPLFISSCTKGDDIRVISFNDSVYFDSYLNPIAILLCYYILALTCKSPVSKTEFTQDESTTEIPTENTPLVRRSTRSKKTPKTENIAMGSMSDETTEAEVRPTVLDEVILGLQSCGNFLYINSYIFTSIIMMVWSIVYHSWLTFVLLIWANALWMIPNQRKTMLRSSPFIVFYAELLLIAQYIYGMDLTDEELPSSVEVQAVNLRQIGFVKPAKYPCAPLMLKTFFILMFWSTMRQLFREQLEKRRSATLANIVAPLQLSVGAATAGLSSETAERKTRFIDKVGEVFKSLLVKLWIWLLVFVIFLCGITGHRMTGFRICYMALFLFFVLAFQLSWRSWTKIMYGYWLVLIVYAMTILILIYTYQFDQFNTYWEKYIGISDTLQKDIGLEKYKTKDLFLHLFNPTLIVVMTVLQVHYFHAKFLESLIKQEVEEVLPNTREEAGEESKQDESPSDGLDKENGDPQKYSLFRRISRRRIEQIVTTTRAAGKQILEYVWIFAELHLMKVIMVVAFWCCLANVCVLHIGFAFLAVIAVVSRMKVQIFISRVISVQMSILLLAKMIYQVDYINHKNYDAICDENSTVSLIYINNAEWFGLSKITESIGLATLVKGYIIYMIVVTLHAVVIFRQGYRRSWLGLENKSPPVMFEGVKRMDAEADLVGLFKFLLNYGYYKFGFEISLIALVSVISYRQDILAILYVMWLCILFKLRRSSSAKLWPSFQFFVAIVIILEYVLFVGLPPGLCMEWPWYNSPYLNGLQSWAMVPGPHLHKQTTKLMFDFILLMFIYRQQRVFTLEKKFIDSNIEYPAGTNKSIVNDIDNLDVTPLDNPVPDFISNVRNWLDILKIAVLNGCFWVTLAVVFLAGTNTISIFSIGYLIGSFIFLWQGTDFYLRPVRSILKWWYVLMGYNVIVISIKTIMQIAGCLFLNTLEQHACWFVHLFGVSCIHDTIAETMGGMKTPMHECQEILDDTGLTWDAVCFTFLIMQLRIFKSYYFHHIINDTKASTTLASRGAEIIEDLREKQIEHKKKHERNVLRKIKKKMEKIRSKQEKMLRHSGERTHASEGETLSNLSSCQGSGYHTPIDDDDEDDEDYNENVQVRAPLEVPSNYSTIKSNISSAPSLLPTQVPTPTSAAMTFSSEGFLEHRKVSLGSAQSYDLKIPTFEESSSIYLSQPGSPEIRIERSDTIDDPVFTADENVDQLDPNQSRKHRRQSSVNAVSWDDAIEPQDDKEKLVEEGKESSAVQLRRRKQSTRSHIIMRDRSFDLSKRRNRNLSWSPGDNIIKRPLRGETYDFGPVGNHFYWESLQLSRRHPVYHPESTRAGDYYMFDDLDEQIELEIDDEDDDYLATQEVAEKKPKRKTFMEGEESTPPEEAPIESSAKDVSEQEEEKSQEKGLVRKVIDSILVAIVIKLNRTSRNYRYVMRILEKEKKVLKESKGFGLGARTGTGNIWTPFKYVKKMEGNDGEPSTQAPSTSQPHLHDPSKTVEHDNDSDDSLGSQVDLSAITPRKEKGSEDDLPTGRRVEDISDYDEDFTSRDHNIFIELLIAIWYAILSNTDLLCYMAALINQVAAASLLSLTIPLMIFLWGTLSIPRPTKTFWITLIAYTQTVVLIKCVFRFKMIWFNQATDSLTTAKIIGIQFVDGTSGYDLILLLMLFFHRFLLKSQGLWKSEYKSDTVDDGAYILLDEPPKTDELDGVSSQEVKDIAVITKDENTLIIARQNPGEQIAEGEVCVHVSNFIEEPGNYLPEIIKVTSAKYCSPIVTFLQDLLYKARLPTDVYAYMFFCDFINFFVLLFGFSAFDNQRADGGLSTYLDENRVPISFLIMLIMQFVLIIVDRALYLRKAIKNRLGFHLFLVLGVHAWMFFIIPSLQGRVFNSQVPTVIFYLVKCVYFILSSYQLRCGYPTRLSGNFFTKGYSIMNMLAFRIYMLIPLLYELRTLLDWVCTDTTMTLFDWLKMEDIFTEIYLMKCARQMESDLPVERGIKKPILTKAMMGGTLIFVVSFLIWGPFVIFALNSAVGISNVPYDVSLSLRIGPYEPVYEMGAQDSSIHIFDQSMKENFQAAYVRSKEATTFLSDYDYNDVAALVLGTSSASLWSISPPDKERFLEDLEKNRTLTCRFRYTLSRKLFNKDSPATISEETVFELTAEHPGRAGLVEMLQGKSTDVEVKLAALLPKFLKVKSGGKIKPVTQLLPVNLEYRDLTIRFYKDAASDQSWWQVNEFCQDPFYENVLSKLPLANCDTKIVIYTFSDKMFPSILTMLTAGGIIGMYTTVVLVGSRILRSFFAGSSRRVIFEELPYVDRVLQLCLDVYLVREAREFALEEDLYAKLLFLYRSPETMIKWTRPKEDNETDDTASGSAKRKSD
ncbi:piezo-type mechanosensitive ion channel component isoform X2 [Hermetia illucens]|uniref:piezo-type mechanosensitive ion channel component isoform X2 n=1 Tax=Hermetia illucens TaxID=343691 RepID=UPI0018CC7586|nr:piezo-type mechanosensitive ion channel component isoform X2 [Hermetia illucens]